MPYRVQTLSETDPMDDFLKVPQVIYRLNPYWVAPIQKEVCRTLNRQVNPYFRNASLRKFVCYKNGHPVARSIAVINREHWKKFGQRSAFFGYFESIRDPKAANTLFHVVTDYCCNEGADILEGPFNPNHYSELGILMNGYQTIPAFFEPYNPDYYPELLAMSGFRTSKTLHTRINTDANNYLRNRYGDTSFPTGTGDYKVRCINFLNLKFDLERIREVNNDAFGDNWHFLPLNSSEYSFSAKYLFFVTTPGLIILIDKGDETVGVIQFMLDINHILQPMNGKAGLTDYMKLMWKRRSVKAVVLYAAAIKKAYQNTKVAWLMLKATCSIAQRYPILSTTWMSEDNQASVKTSEHLGLVPYKWFSIYEKTLS